MEAKIQIVQKKIRQRRFVKKNFFDKKIPAPCRFNESVYNINTMNKIVLLMPLLLILSPWASAQSPAPINRQVPHVVVLTDGSILPGAVVSLDSRRVEIERLSAPESLKVDLKFVAGIIFSRPVPDLEEQKLIYSLIGSTNSADEYLDCAGNSYFGTFGQMSGFNLVWESNSKSVVVPVTQIRAVIFSASVRTTLQENSRKAIGTRDGSLIYASSIEQKDNCTYVHTDWNSDPLIFNQLDITFSSIDISGDYLDALPVIEYKYIPFWTLPRQYGVNYSPEGAWLTDNTSTTYLHGFFQYASSRLTFTPKADSKYTRLSGVIARPVQAIQGAVRFRIFTNGKPVFNRTLNAADMPEEFSVAVESLRRIDLVVDFADNSPVSDTAIWGNVKLE